MPQQAGQEQASDGMPETEGAGLFVTTGRKADPAAALCYGLGAERSAMFPGWFGDFLRIP
jgi:hypothetical protein